MREVTSEEMRELRSRANWVTLNAPTFEPYPMTVHSLPDVTLLVESLRPSAERPHLLFESPMEFDLWRAEIGGKPYVPYKEPATHSEYLGLFERIERPGFPDDLPGELLKSLGRKRLTLDFSRASVEALQTALRRRRDELGDTVVALSALYVLEAVRRAVGGTWTRERHVFGEDLAIRAPGEKVLDFTVELVLDLAKWNGLDMLDLYDAHVGRGWPRQAILDSLEFVRLIQDPLFPDHLPPLLRLYLGDHDLELTFDREGVGRLSEALLRDGRPPGERDAWTVALFVVEAARYATGRDWLSNVVEGPMATMRGYVGRDIDFAGLVAVDLETTGGMNLVAIYDQMVSGAPAEL